MNRENCQDREGTNHFSEFGWYDGFQGSCSNCRIGLDARNRGACESSDECAEACLESIHNTGQNIISENIANMHAGEGQKRKEELEDKAIAVAEREAKKKKVADDKIKAEEEEKKAEEEAKNPVKKEEVKPVEEKKTEEVKETPKVEEVKPVVIDPPKETPKEPIKEEPKNA